MSYWKDTLCFLTIIVLWAIVGHFDYEEAVVLDKAARNQALQPCPKPGSQVPESASAGLSGTAVLKTSAPRKPKRPCTADEHRDGPP